MAIEPNALCHSDALALLERLDDGEARLVYLDPPWFSHPLRAAKGVGFRETLGLRDYLTYLSRVMQQSHRVLAEDGNIFVRSEQSLTRKFGLVLDQVFRDNFRREFVITYRRGSAGSRHETILHYSKSACSVVNRVFRPLTSAESSAFTRRDSGGPFKLVDLFIHDGRPSLRYEWHGTLPPANRSWRYSAEELKQLENDGRIYFPEGRGTPKLKVYLSESAGVDVGTHWDDIHPTRPASRYPTQQPVALLERIVQIGSNPGDLVVDPFCGTGTCLVAAHLQGRRWIGCDSSPDAVSVAAAHLASHGLTDGESGGYAMYSPAMVAREEPRPCFYRRVVTLAEDVNEGEVLIAEGESQWVEFKVSAIWNPFTGRPDERNKEKVVRSVAAFLNSKEGGTLLLGVDDDGTVRGLAEDYKIADARKSGRDKFELWLRNVINSRLGGGFAAFYRIQFESIGGNDVCLVRIAPANRPCYIGDVFCVRTGNQTVEMKPREAVEYARQRW